MQAFVWILPVVFLLCSMQCLYFRLNFVVFAASKMAASLTFITFYYLSKIIWRSPEYTMDMSMEIQDWALLCSWPPAGDRWQYSVDQFFEPFDVLGIKSDDAEFQPFSDDIVLPNHSFNSAWSTDGSCMNGLLAYSTPYRRHKACWAAACSVEGRRLIVAASCTACYASFSPLFVVIAMM